MKIIVLILTFIFLVGCRSGDNAANSNAQNSAQSNSNAANAASWGEFAVGDKVLHHSSSGQRFYEASIVSMEGKKARVNYHDETIESDVADLYRIPKAGEKKDIKAGDIVAARFGKTLVWAGAEVVSADGDKVTVKWLSTGKNDEVSSDSILTLSAATQARVKKAFGD